MSKPAVSMARFALPFIRRDLDAAMVEVAALGGEIEVVDLEHRLGFTRIYRSVIGCCAGGQGGDDGAGRFEQGFSFQGRCVRMKRKSSRTSSATTSVSLQMPEPMP